MDSAPKVNMGAPSICMFDGPAEKVADCVKEVQHRGAHELGFSVLIYNGHLQRLVDCG